MCKCTRSLTLYKYLYIVFTSFRVFFPGTYLKNLVGTLTLKHWHRGYINSHVPSSAQEGKPVPSSPPVFDTASGFSFYKNYRVFLCSTWLHPRSKRPSPPHHLCPLKKSPAGKGDTEGGGGTGTTPPPPYGSKASRLLTVSGKLLGKLSDVQ